MTPIYLDHNATTPMDPEVLEAMRPHFLAGGNAESRHASGRSARRAWEQARETVARILGAEPSEVIFTSGGTESNNLAIFGLAGAETLAGARRHQPDRAPGGRRAGGAAGGGGLRGRPRAGGRRGPGRRGAMAATFRDDTRFATLMLANNETGAIQPVGELADAGGGAGDPRCTPTPCRRWAGSRSISTRWAWRRWRPAPTSSTDRWGSGLLLVRSGVRLGSRLFGGGQQQGRRPGTVAVPLAVGLAAALENWHEESAARAARWTALRDRLEAGLIAALGPDRVDPQRPDSTTTGACRRPSTSASRASTATPC